MTKQVVLMALIFVSSGTYQCFASDYLKHDPDSGAFFGVSFETSPDQLRVLDEQIPQFDDFNFSTVENHFLGSKKITNRPKIQFDTLVLELEIPDVVKQARHHEENYWSQFPNNFEGTGTEALIIWVGNESPWSDKRNRGKGLVCGIYKEIGIYSLDASSGNRPHYTNSLTFAKNSLIEPYRKFLHEFDFSDIGKPFDSTNEEDWLLLPAYTHRLANHEFLVELSYSSIVGVAVSVYPRARTKRFERCRKLGVLRAQPF